MPSGSSGAPEQILVSPGSLGRLDDAEQTYAESISDFFTELDLALTMHQADGCADLAKVSIYIPVTTFSDPDGFDAFQDFLGEMSLYVAAGDVVWATQKEVYDACAAGAPCEGGS